MGVKTAFAGGFVTGAFVLFTVGAASAIGQSTTAEAKQATVVVHSSPQVPAPPPPARIIKVPGPVSVPGACLNYLSEVDTTVAAVYDYENGIGPSHQALVDGLTSLVEHDPSLLNKARTKLNHAENATTGPLQALIAGTDRLKVDQLACHKALGGHR